MAQYITAENITAAAVVIYTVGTFLLWWTTRAQLRTTRDALKLTFLQTYIAAKPNDSDAPAPFRLSFNELGYQAHLRKVFPELLREFGLAQTPPSRE